MLRSDAVYRVNAHSCSQDPDNTFYRPILFVTENATRVSVEGITQLNSPCWTNFFVGSNDISFDNVYIEASSNNASVSLPLLAYDHD